MDNNSKYWQDGEAYHRTAIGAKKRPQVFTPEIIYNLLAMAIEKYFMAFFESHHTTPENHTFSDLINAANKIKPLPAELEKELLSLEGLQNICPIFEAYHRHSPDAPQIELMYEVTNNVAVYCRHV